jgi:hypothetical protein
LKLVKVHTAAHKVDPAKLKGWLLIWLLNISAACM